MTELHRRSRTVRAYWKAIRSQAGAFDLPSIITGVVVVGILAAGVLAAIFGVIPFAQDKAAQQDLDTVRTAEGVAKSQLGGFKDKNALISGGLISGDGASMGVGTDAAGSCYVGISKSASGNVYFNSDRTMQPALLTASVDTGCIDAATRDAILAEIGGYGPSTGSPSAGAPTDGSSTDPTGGTGGTGGSGGNTVLAADTWSAQRTITNVYPDPGFKNGSSGWTGDVGNFVGYTDDAVVTVGATGSGYNGDAGALRISATGSAGHDRATAYFPIEEADPKYMSFEITTPDGTWDPAASWYSGFMFTDKVTGEYIGAATAAQPTRAGGLGANVWERLKGINNFSKPSQPHNTYLYIQADHIPAGRTVTMLVDRMFVSGSCGWDCVAPASPSVAGYEPNFDGSYASSPDWTYSWTGAVNASPSKAVSPKAIAAPANATAGSTIEIKGSGYAPNSTVTPAIFFGFANGWEDRDFTGAPVQTDGSGGFTTTMLLPETTQSWSWGVTVAEDTSWPAIARMSVNVPPGTGAAAATPPGPWSALVEGSTEQISAPAVVTRGSDITVVGRGYAPFTEVDLYDNSWYGEASAYADSNGYFSVTLHIPTEEESYGDSAPGPGVIYAYGDDDVELNVTYQ